MYLFYCALLLLAGSVQLVLSEEEDTRLPCKLEWIHFSTGNLPPETAVNAQGTGVDQTKQLVIRGSDKIVGRYDVESELPFIPTADENGTALNPPAFDLLTNPYGCITMWTNMDPQFRVSAGDNVNYVGRTQYDPNSSYGQWYSGNIKEDAIDVAAPDENGTRVEVVTKTIEFQYFISYSKGLLLTIEDFVFDEGSFASNPDFMSQDEIHNYSPAMVSQIISHEKRIRERLEITITNTTVSRSTSTTKKNVIISSKKTEETHTYTRTEKRTYITETETNVTASLELMVAPHTSIKACSSVEISEGKDIEYVATGTYSAPGMTPLEVYNLVKIENLPGLQFQDQSKVIVPVTGKLTVNLAMTTKFVVSPADSEDNECSLVKRNILKQN